MNRRHQRATSRRALLQMLVWAALVLVSVKHGNAQGGPYERTFPQSKMTVEQALKGIQAAMAGHLPTLEGFALPKDQPLDHYQRSYYQSSVQVIPTSSGGSLVRVTTKVTAWYADPVPSRSGYRLLTSNGRLEGDLLDQLAEVLAGSAPIPATNSPTTTAPSPGQPDAAQPTISAPVPRFPEVGHNLSSAVTPVQSQPDSQPLAAKPADKNSTELQAEAESLEEILKNQSHPKNLVAVKKSGTPVVAAPLDGKALFLASAHDEFEMLDFNSDWVHVRISGLARGWILRSSLEMPGTIPDADPQNAGTPGPTVGDLLHVTREEVAPFPGDWAPLRDTKVKIISVEKTNDEAKDMGPDVRLDYALSLLDKNYAELMKPTPALSGIVLIFDSADGGMIAATRETIKQWKAGKLSDAALWHQCFFDPPEAFDASSSYSSSRSSVSQ
jgi:hypothetical protein